MRYTLFVILLLVAPRGVVALTWDFDDGSTWGWTARESSSYSTQGTSEPLRSEVVGGVWRIAPVPGRRPTVLLHSPLIGEDSALFDRLTLRLRLIHHSPTEDLFLMNWSNAVSRRPDSNTNGVFGTGHRQPYPLEWEDITIDLRALAEADTEWAITWQDTLFNFSLDMVLYRDSQDVDNHPKFLEIDWIQLTGAEELAQGEFPFLDLWGSDFDGDGLLDLVTAEDGIVEVWYNWGGGFEPRPWAAIQDPPRSFEAGVNPSALHLLADLDGNGMVDLLGSPERIGRFGGTDYYGLALWRLDASGEVVRHSLLDWKAFIAHEATASDLNGDGLPDVALVVGNSTVGSALVVLLGQRNGAPVLEGHYSLPGEGSQVFASDVNGDDNTDLVVLGTSPASGHGGVFVLINQGTPATAVTSETAVMPTAFALGANYPNPFNPATIIPLAVPDRAKNVDLTIYNVLGQPMRRVWAGALAAGEHELTWDGRDAQGHPVAAGVYVYRLQVGEQSSTRKMVKLD